MTQEEAIKQAIDDLNALSPEEFSARLDTASNSPLARALNEASEFLEWMGKMENYDYCPDGWQFVLIAGSEVKVFGSWSGGYLGSDHWRINSGTESIEQDDEAFYAYGWSGSIYKLYKVSEGRLNAYSMGVLEHFKQSCEAEQIGFELINVSEAFNFIRIRDDT